MAAQNFRSAFLPMVDKLRGLPVAFGVRLYTVTITARTWTGDRVGKGTKTDVTTGLKVDLGFGPVKARTLTAKEVVASGGLYEAGDWEIGPITPPYTGSSSDNDAISVWDPPVTSASTEIFYTVTGPGLTAPGNTFKKVERRVDKPFRYMFVLRKIAVTP